MPLLYFKSKVNQFQRQFPPALTKAAGYGCTFFIHIVRLYNFNDSQHYFHNSNISAFADTFVLEEMKFYFFLFVLTVSASSTHSSYLWKPVSLNRIGWKVPPSTEKVWNTRSSWLNCALRDDEALYWVSLSIGHYEATALGNWWYWVSRGHLCLYILHKVEIWKGVTHAWQTDRLWKIVLLSSL